ncbi:MAG: pilus assembly protein [Gemmataceae bacterium]|nr:pilus assembly protein [Gemmataceae bacterium]
MIRTAHLHHTRRGTAAAEFAIVAVFLAPLLIGVWEVGRLVEVQQHLVNGVREGGRQAATGIKDIDTVKLAVVNYLTQNGISCSVSEVTVTNETDSSRLDPRTAKQLDRFRVSITIPFNRVRWILLNQVTNTTQLSATADWYSMRDIPLELNTEIPLQ